MENIINTKKTKPFIPLNFLHTQYLHLLRIFSVLFVYRYEASAPLTSVHGTIRYSAHH